MSSKSKARLPECAAPAILISEGFGRVDARSVVSAMIDVAGGIRWTLDCQIGLQIGLETFRS